MFKNIFKTKFLQKCMRFNYEAVNMSSYYELYLYYYPIVRHNFGALLSHKVMCNWNFFNIYKHYKFTELKPTYSNTLVCFKIFHFIKFTLQNPNRCIWNM